ncbi:hypothetical protein GQX73_g60 [Xylaria multiplex]|uniref:Uncharacterized protein n=1 Tax=Xylaria multiplex TaxID=323545 RepID=A0A7C8N1S4_9PEZI|nr:hypothetical protein GQX73_g60 [Xylaria multiplex]
MDHQTEAGSAANNQASSSQAKNNQYALIPAIPAPAPAPLITDVYNEMKGFLKSTHWSKPYYSSLVHNNPELPYHMLEHVNCTYLSTPGRPPTLLALKQHAQSLAALISWLAPAQYGATFEPPNDGKVNADAAFAADQAFDWLNNMKEHYNTEDRGHKKPLNALLNLVKSNSDTEGPKWHCPLDNVGIELAEKHPFQQYRPYESHLTLLMHANEILERLDHEYSAMGGLLGIIPLENEKVDEGQALKQAKTTLVGQWILYTQHLVVRMHELEIAYGNSLDLLANEAIVPLQHISVHGPDGRSGREIIFPQDKWILANAGEDVFTFIHQMLDRAETHQDNKDDVFEEQKVLGDAAYSGNDTAKYRGIVKVDLSTRFYRLRGSGHGPLFVLPAFGDRANTKHTRDIESRPTVLTIPQPDNKESVNSWESKHKDVESKVLTLSVKNSNLEAKVSQLNSSIQVRDREIERLNEFQKQYDDIISKDDKDVGKQIVFLNEHVEYFRRQVQEGEERHKALEKEIQTFKNANITAQNGGDPLNNLIEQVNKQQAQIRKLEKDVKERDEKIEEVKRDKYMLQITTNPTINNSVTASPQQVTQLKEQLASCHTERQMLLQEIHNLKKAKAVKGKILNFAEGFKLEYGSTFEDTNLGVTVCSTTFYKALLAAEMERNDLQHKTDSGTINTHTIQEELNRCKAESELLRQDNNKLRKTKNTGNLINIPWRLEYTSTFRDDNQGLIVLNTQWYDKLVEAEKGADIYTGQIAELNAKIESLKAPVNVNLASIPSPSGSLKDKLGQAKVYKDTQQNVANYKLVLLDLNNTKQQLDNLLKSKNNTSSELPSLQHERDELLAKLDKALKKCKGLEQQIVEISKGKPGSSMDSKILELKKQLEDCAEKVEEKEKEVTDAKNRYNSVLMSELNLQNEVQSLRQQLVTAKSAATKGKMVQQPGSSGGDAQTQLKTEVKLYKDELSTMQELWNDLQTQNVNLQTQLDNAEKNCEEDKAHLHAKLQEAEAEKKVLQMKVIADPNKLQPAMIELEAQRDAALQTRDELREQFKAVRQQLQQLQQLQQSKT